jgi:hypothetical protein
MTNKKSISLQDYILFPENYERYLKEAKKLEFLISNKGHAEFAEFMDEILDFEKFENLEKWKEQQAGMTQEAKDEKM